MTNPVISAALVCFSLRLLPVIVSVLVKTMILLTLAFVLHWIMRNASPRLRHRLWMSAIVCCLLVLGLSLRGPLYKGAVLRTGGVPGARRGRRLLQ